MVKKKTVSKQKKVKKEEPTISGIVVPHWTLINKFYPPQFGFVRRIIPLWDTHYRVNFHCLLDENKIYDSYFVDVDELKSKMEASTLCTGGA